LRKLKINSTPVLKPVEKRKKKLDLTKYKKKMSCSVEKTQNKIDFWG